MLVPEDSAVAARRDDPAVGGHLVAGGDQHDVAHHHLVGGDLCLGPVAAHPGGRLHHRLQGVHRAFGLALLPHPDHRVQHGQQDQQDPGAPLLDDQRHHGRHEQDDLHVRPVLVQKPAPARLGLLLRQRVRAVRGQQFGGPGGRQPGGHVHAKLGGDLFGRARIPVPAHRRGLPPGIGLNCHVRASDPAGCARSRYVCSWMVPMCGMRWRRN